MIRRCLNWPVAPERKAIRSGRPRGSSRLRRILAVPGSIAPRTIVGASGLLDGHSCPSESARGTNWGAWSRRKTRISRGRKPPVTRMALPGSGWLLPQSGALSWPVSSARARKLKPIYGWSGWRMAPRTCSLCLPATHGRHTAPRGCLWLENAVSRHGVARGAHTRIDGAFPPKSGAMPQWSRRAHGVTWGRATTQSCVATLNVWPRSWPCGRRVRRSRPAWSNERRWRFANIIAA
jgi:hypothetical protein